MIRPEGKEEYEGPGPREKVRSQKGDGPDLECSSSMLDDIAKLGTNRSVPGISQMM